MYFLLQEDSEGTKALAGEGLREASRGGGARGAGGSGRSPGRRPAAATAEDGETAAASNQELRDWLQQHPSYTMDMSSFTPVRPVT